MESTARKRKHCPSDDSSSDEQGLGEGRDSRLIPQALRPANDTISDADEILPAAAENGSTFEFAGQVIIQSRELATFQAWRQTSQTLSQYPGYGPEIHVISCWTVAVFVGATHTSGPLGAGIALGFRRINPDVVQQGDRKEVARTFRIHDSSLLCDHSTHAIAILEGLEAAYSELESAIQLYGIPKADVAHVVIFSPHDYLLSVIKVGGQKLVAPRTKAHVVQKRILNDIAAGSHQLVQKMAAIGVKVELELHWCPSSHQNSRHVRILSRDARKDTPRALASASPTVSGVYERLKDELGLLYEQSTLPANNGRAISGVDRGFKRMRLARQDSQEEDTTIKDT